MPLSGCCGVSGLFAGGGHRPEHSPSEHAGSADVGRAGAELAVGGGAGAVAVVVAAVPTERLGTGMIDAAVGVVAQFCVLHVVSVDVQGDGFSPGRAGTCGLFPGPSGTTPRVGALLGG